MPADLEAADEVFITSTTRELLPVYSVEGLSTPACAGRCWTGCNARLPDMCGATLPRTGALPA